MDNRPKIPEFPDKHVIPLILTIVVLIAAPIIGGGIGLIIDGAILAACILILTARQTILLNELHEVHLKVYDLQEKINEIENIKSDE